MNSQATYELTSTTSPEGWITAYICVGDTLRFEIFSGTHLCIICMDDPHNLPEEILQEIADLFGEDIEEVIRNADDSFNQMMWEKGTDNALQAYPWLASKK